VSGTPTQDWSVVVSQQPLASAPVGDTVTVKASIIVDAGADDLSVNSLSSGSGTSGLDQVAFVEGTPFTISAGTTNTVTATARVVAAPGTAGVHLQVSVNGFLGALAGIRTADSNAITSKEAVTAVLSGAPPTVNLGDQISYKLTLTNDSDTVAEILVPAAGFGAPSGSTFVSRTNGVASLTSGSSTDYVLIVGVSSLDADGTMIVQAPSGVTYAMSDFGLPARVVTVTPASITSIVHAPVVEVGSHTLTDANGGTLVPGDVVEVSITVANLGDEATTATLSDALTNLANPASVRLDGLACGDCMSTSTSVTVPLHTLADGGSHVVTFAVTVPVLPVGTTAASSATVAFSPATAGTSPTTADVASLSIMSDLIFQDGFD